MDCDPPLLSREPEIEDEHNIHVGDPIVELSDEPKMQVSYSRIVSTLWTELTQRPQSPQGCSITSCTNPELGEENVPLG